MKKANFDVSHELDEFLMVEKPLTHSKLKANPDLEKMKPELRQLEEQYVIPLVVHPDIVLTYLSFPDSPCTTLQSRLACHTTLIMNPSSPQITTTKENRPRSSSPQQTPSYPPAP